MFNAANKAQVIRSKRKDEYYVIYLRSSLYEVVHSCLGVGVWFKWRRELEVLAGLLYFGLTTVGGYQTLGEEYTHVAQVDSSLKRVTSFWLRTCLVATHVVGPYALERSLAWCDRALVADTHPIRGLSIAMKTRLAACVPAARHAVLLLQRCHLAVFYQHGVFYDLAKRLFGIHYVAVRRVRDAASSERIYRVLGWLSLAHVLLSAAHSLYTAPPSTAVSAPAPHHPAPGLAVAHCTLCLEPRTHTTATPCGHLYCWSCILNWLASKPECPLCRDTVKPSQLIYLQNYL